MERVYIEMTIPSLSFEVRKMKPDRAIDDIREVRRKISAECGHDAQRFLAHYEKIEEQIRADGKYQFTEADDVAPRTIVLNDRPKK
jgi:hypothetical protein